MKFLGSIINSVGEIQLSLIGTIFVYAKIGHDILISSKPQRILKEGKFMSHITIIKQLCNRTFESLQELDLELFDYVNWWNHLRLHGTLGYETPVGYRNQKLAQSIPSLPSKA